MIGDCKKVYKRSGEFMGGIKDTDVLVIGSGGAGCRAALEAFQLGAKVTILSKGAFGKSGTTAFRVADTAGYNVADAFVDERDNPEKHYEDIIHAGMGMAYPELARILAKEALETIPYLEGLGVRFERDPSTGKFIEVRGCFATLPRMHVLKNHGEPIIKALVSQIKKQPIQIVEQTAISRLLLREGHCVGAVGINSDGEPVIFRAKGVVLASGGAGQLFKYSLAPSDITGDGYALGLRAGAVLVNMEYMQVVVGTVAPTQNQLNAFLWSAQPRLVNEDGDFFLKNYLPKDITAEECARDKSTHFPFSTRDKSRFIEIAIQKETLRKRGGSESKIFLDLTGVTDRVVSKLPEDSPLPKVWPFVKEFLKRRGLRIEKEPIQVACFAHAINGGLRIDAHGSTNVTGLYAAGEVAGGPHGADRLGGNMLVTCQVFGARAGQTAAKSAAEGGFLPLPEWQVSEEIDRLRRLGIQKGQERVDDLRLQLQQIMWEGVLVVRTAESLSKTLKHIERIQQKVQDAKIEDKRQLRAVLELQNLIDVGTAIAQAALYRKESRGSHYREDFPAINPKWQKRLLLRHRDGKIQICEEKIS
jgi:fumarate reductase (CoM/CoB) subunit A